MPCRWTWPSAVAKPMARRRKRVSSSGRLRMRSRGSLPLSSSTSAAFPLCRASARGRAAHLGSRSAASAYSCSSRLRLEEVGRSATSTRTGTALPSCRARDRTNSPLSRSVSSWYPVRSIMEGSCPHDGRIKSDRTPFRKGLVGVVAWLPPSAESGNSARRIVGPRVDAPRQGQRHGRCILDHAEAPVSRTNRSPTKLG